MSVFSVFICAGPAAMATCRASASRFLSERWVSLAKMVWGTSQIDQMRLAKYSLQKAIADIEVSEAGMKQELIAIARKVRQMDRATMKNATLQQVKRSRYLRQQLGMMAGKRSALERHLDTLNSSELNQLVINSVKETSSALKSMGLDAALKQADGLQLDMEEQISDMHNLQKVLATPLFDDAEDSVECWDAELDLLLQDFDDEITACVAVPLVNSMERPQPARVAGAEARPGARPEAGVGPEAEMEAEMEGGARPEAEAGAAEAEAPPPAEKRRTGKKAVRRQQAGEEQGVLEAA